MESKGEEDRAWLPLKAADQKQYGIPPLPHLPPKSGAGRFLDQQVLGDPAHPSVGCLPPSLAARGGGGGDDEPLGLSVREKAWSGWEGL